MIYLKRYGALTMLLWMSVFIHAEKFFRSESVAIQLNMPNLAEKTLLNHRLDAFPKGSECRMLLAKINFLKQNFSEMRHHLNLSEKRNGYTYLYTLLDVYSNQPISLVPLISCSTEDDLGIFLSKYNEVIFEPLRSIRWANFWENVLKCYSLKNYATLYHWALEVKFAMEQKCFSEELDVSIWQTVASFLHKHQRFEDLKLFLKKTLPEIKNPHERLHCLLWLLKANRCLKGNLDVDILNYLINAEDDVEMIDTVFSEWLSFVPDIKQQLSGLKKFCKIYKRKNFRFHYQYLQLLQARCFIEMGAFDRAKRILDKYETSNNRDLQSFRYELLAKYTLCQNPTNYRLAASFLEEARQKVKLVKKDVLYGQIQAECYCLAEEYERAFCIYQEILGKVVSSKLGDKLAYEWILCGILCQESSEELQQQVKFCRSLNFLNFNQEQRLCLVFSKNLIERKQYLEALDYLESIRWRIPSCNEEAKFLCSKASFLLGNYQEAQRFLDGVDRTFLSYEALSDYYLWMGYTLYALEDNNGVLEWLGKLELLTGNIPLEIQAQAKILQAKVFSRQYSLDRAKNVLLEFCPQADKEWRIFLMFQAGCYAEGNDVTGQQEAIQIFQKVYEMDQRHPLAVDARLKQGILLMNLNQLDLAQAVFKSILPNLKRPEQVIWCRYLLQKCLLMSHKQALSVSRTKLEILLKETMPLSLRLEIALQLAFVYKDEGNLNALQKLLWDECYPLLIGDETPILTVNEVHWLSRCLLVLVQHTKDMNVVHQIYALMVEAQLPNASMIKQYLEGV